MNENAIVNIHLALVDGALSSIEDKNTTNEIYDTLTKLYEEKSLYNKIILKRRLYTLRMTKSTSMTDYINILNTLFSQLTTLRHTISVNEHAELLLQSLSDSYDQLIINLTNNILRNNLVFDNVAAAVLEEENQCKNKEDRQTSSQQANALLVTRGRSIERGSSGSHTHGRSKSRSDCDNSKSTTCYVFALASGAVSWILKLQSVVANSTTEAEYVVATQASKEAIWLKMVLEQLGYEHKKISLFCDS
ncbi:uncharacterized protein LOC109846911 [Asparagus officinalis]|uniref:uncharacterized protein LOC109846911 n=1 Tax=Asparagus officinalis TaxID=4686 RepID=UPI00098E0B8D|nr:uncharacterized protein LOC109846911 [Asparagus officinalis]